MKQIIRLSLLVLTLSIPFALSQTRKAIPAGRYEALSGVKNSHNKKNAESLVMKDSLGLFWSEIAKHIPQGRNENLYYSSGMFDPNFKNFLSSKGVHQAQALDSRVNIVLSDDLKRDGAIFKKIKIRGSLLILKDKLALSDVMSTIDQYELVIFQAESDNNYYLLKHK